MNLCPFPPSAKRLCHALTAPARLVAHLRLVHDVASRLVQGLARTWPKLVLDREAILFGAAIHDLGKVLHPGELTGPGHRHQNDGPALLERHGVSHSLARFAKSHGAWATDRSLSLEDLLVALADTIWKDGRNSELEGLVVEQLSSRLSIEPWEVFRHLDDLQAKIGSRGEERLAWLARFAR